MPETTISVWRELYKFLSKYNLILQERRDLIVEIDGLRVSSMYMYDNDVGKKFMK